MGQRMSVNFSDKESLVMNGRALKVLSNPKYTGKKDEFLRDMETAWYGHNGNTIPLMPEGFKSYIEEVYDFYLMYVDQWDWEQSVRLWQVPRVLYSEGLENGITHFLAKKHDHLERVHKSRHPKTSFTTKSMNEYTDLCDQSKHLAGKISALSKKSEKLAMSSRVAESNEIEFGPLRALQNQVGPINLRIADLMREAIDRAASKPLT